MNQKNTQMADKFVGLPKTIPASDVEDKALRPKRRRTVSKSQPKANYGAKERPRQCPNCTSTNSSVKQTYRMKNPDRVSRRRLCDACGRLWSSLETL